MVGHFLNSHRKSRSNSSGAHQQDSSNHSSTTTSNSPRNKLSAEAVASLPPPGKYRTMHQILESLLILSIDFSESKSELTRTVQTISFFFVT